MPGLFGILSKHKDLGRSHLRVLAEGMAASMRHVPWLRTELWGDECFCGGRVHLGVLHPEPQPQVSEDGRTLVWVDGELFPEATSASADPLGAAAISRLMADPSDRLDSTDGSFNLARFDRVARDLVLANDRLGFRPLFYMETPDWFAYAGEVKALLAICPRLPDLDEVGLRQFFGFDHMLGDRTWWKGIALLPPASCWRISSREIQRRRYWTFDQISRKLRDEAEVRDEFARLWAEEVRRRSLPGTTALLLSGGQDSRFLLAELRAQQADVLAVTVGSPDSIELPAARQAARVAGVPHRIVHIGPHNWWQRREEAIWQTDGLVSCFHLNFVSAVDEMRSGNGLAPMNVIGDLLFGGSHLEKDLLNLDARRSPNPLLAPRYVENPFFPRDEVLGVSLPDALLYVQGPSSDCFHLHQRIRRANLTSHRCLAAHCELGFPSTGVSLLELFLGGLGDEQRVGHRFYNRFLVARYPEYFARIPWQATGRALVESRGRRWWRRHIRYRAYRLLGRSRWPKPVPSDRWFLDYPECLRHSRIRERFAREALLADEFLGGAAGRVLADPQRFPLGTQALLGIVTFETYLRQVAGMPNARPAAHAEAAEPRTAGLTVS